MTGELQNQEIKRLNKFLLKKEKKALGRKSLNVLFKTRFGLKNSFLKRIV